MIPLKDFAEIIPLLIITCAALLTMVLEITFKKNAQIIYGFSIVAIIAALATSFTGLNKDQVIFNNYFHLTNVTIAFTVTILVGMLITIISAKSYLEKEDINFGEFYSLLLFAIMGMFLMIWGNDILIIFIGLELMSICFYILAGFLRKRPKSNESALKYFLLGAFMTGFIIYGISLMYGVTGTTNLTILYSNPENFKSSIFVIGFGLYLIGFLFKMGIFPFHMWIPDVYDGAPTIVSGMMSTAGKIAAVGTILPFILNVHINEFQQVFSVLAVITMLFGNVIALAQTNIKRLLAYSSISSAGYIMVGIASMNELATKGIAYYLVAYTFMQLGAFLIVSIIEKKSADSKDYANLNLDSYKGLAKRNPWLATFMTLFLFSLAGIPPFAGFWGKYYLFFASIKAGLIWLSVIGILLSLVSIYYYLRVIVYMWFSEADSAQETENVSFMSMTGLSLAIVGTLVFGFFPNLFFNLFKFL
ncbi:MAG: NADH-quinone oxidoreductase subunit N [Ignavibacteria bacterium]|nr:NADH-quinone oxidoreductase subunit N [Ignavibacteria bacterium]